jgi:ADP-ribose pyrophosphatase YjhB (NUDIX family)
VGVGAVVLEKGKILLVKRGVPPDLHKWTLPGGAVELGEKVRDALKREIQEECSIEIELIDDQPFDTTDLIFKTQNNKYQYHYVVIQFLAKRRWGIIKPKQDVIAAKWIPIKKAKNYDLTKSFQIFLEKHQKTLEKIS